MGKDRLPNVNWVEPAAMGWCTNVDCIRVDDPTIDPAQLFGNEQQVVGHLDLESGSRIWITRSTQKLSDHDFAIWQKELGNAVFRRTDPPGPPALRDPTKPADAAFGAIMSPAAHHFPVIREINLGHYNLPPPDVG